MPAEPKLTPWIDWPAKPVRVGPYDVRLFIRPGEYGPPCRLRWNGNGFWSRADCRPMDEWRLLRGDQWRGLAEPPKEQGNDN